MINPVGQRPILVVTGASGGIGSATVALAASRGFAVVLGYHAHEDRARMLEETIRKSGGHAQAMPVDVADPESVQTFFARIDRDVGRLAGVVLAAGMSGGVSRLSDLRPEDIARVVNVNFLGVLYCAREAATWMARSRGGHGGSIVSLSSEAAKFGGNKLVPYAAAKAGVSTMTIGLARELASEGIRVNAVSPGIIDTEQHGRMDADRRAGLVNSIPMGRMGRSEEVAECVLWLLSDSASYVTGAILSVHGGR
jgi:NAD(P)-dependent dehydrogenase (short-subunit alcohol dehydrogenase family)